MVSSCAVLRSRRHARGCTRIDCGSVGQKCSHRPQPTQSSSSTRSSPCGPSSTSAPGRGQCSTQAVHACPWCVRQVATSSSRLAHHDVVVRVRRQQRARRTDVAALQARAQHARLLARVDRRRARGRAPVGAEREDGVGRTDLDALAAADAVLLQEQLVQHARRAQRRRARDRHLRRRRRIDRPDRRLERLAPEGEQLASRNAFGVLGVLAHRAAGVQ